MSLAPLTQAWRSLRRAPLFTASVVLSLTIGLGAVAAISAIVDGVLLRPLPFGHPDRLVGVSLDMPPLSLRHMAQSASTFLTFRRFAHTIDAIALYDEESVNVSDPSGRGEPERMTATSVTANGIPMLQVNPIIGRAFTEEEDQPRSGGPRVVVIGEGVWRTRFGGDRGVIGKSLSINGRSTEIIGVMPARFSFPSAGNELWLPLQLDPNDNNGFSYNAIARLRSGVTVDAAQRDFARVLPLVVSVNPLLAPGMPMQTVLDQGKPVPRLTPMRDDVVGGIARTLWMVAATALLVLLVTAANVANLLLVRADARSRELSLRAALGAGRTRVLAHFFWESGLLAALSVAVGLAIAALGIRALVHASGAAARIPRLAEVHVDATVAAWTVAAAALVALVCSVLPAIRFLRAGPLSGLRDGGRGGTIGGHRQRARSALVAAQVAFALVVLAASTLLLRSLERLRGVRPGFNPDGVATVWLDLPRQRWPNDTAVVQLYARLVEHVAQLPGVAAAGVASNLPTINNGLNENPVYVEGDVSTGAKIPPLETYVKVDSGYFRALGIPLLAGRTFDRLERQRGDEAVINQETARDVFHDSTGLTALNKRFRELPTGKVLTVVGVVGSIRDTSLSAPPSRLVYLPESLGGDTLTGRPSRQMAVVAHTSADITATVRAIQRAVHDADPTLPTFQAQSLREAANASMARLTFTILVLGVAAGITLLLSVVGLYGVIAYIVILRTRELGVRIALGAQPRAVALMVTRHGLLLCAGGIAAGLVLFTAVARFLRSFLFEVSPADPATLAAVALTLLVFALTASWIAARRAGAMNPVEALRAE